MKIVSNIFGEFIDIEQPCNCVKFDVIINYIVHLRNNKKVSEITINSYLRGIRAFLYYCMEHGCIMHFKIQLLKTEKNIKPTYTDNEFIFNLNCMLQDNKLFIVSRKIDVALYIYI